MKAKRLVSAAVSLAASAAFALSAGAYMSVVSSPAPGLETSRDEWALVFARDSGAPVDEMSKIELVITVTGDYDKYLKEKADGYYDDGSDKEFVDFEGHLGIGAAIEGTDNKYWYAFNYKTLDKTEGGGDSLKVKPLGNNQYMLTGIFDDVKVHTSEESDTQIRFREWGNKSSACSLTVDDLFVYGPDGGLVIYADASGNCSFGSDALQSASSKLETYAALTTENVSPAPGTSAQTEAAVTVSEETTAAVTSAGPADSAAPETTRSAARPSADGFDSRDSTLLIVGIAAGVIIIAIIVALILMIIKKKK